MKIYTVISGTGKPVSKGSNSTVHIQLYGEEDRATPIGDIIFTYCGHAEPCHGGHTRYNVDVRYTPKLNARTYKMIPTK